MQDFDILKKILFCIFGVFLCSFQLLYGQASVLDKRVSGKYEKVPLKQVFADLSKATQIRFSYSPKQINDDTLISISFNQVQLNEALQKISNQLSLEFEWVDNYIILKKSIKTSTEKTEEIKPPVPVNYTISGYIKDSSDGEFLPGATLYIRDKLIGTTTNGYGFFSLSLPQGKYNLEISYLGYDFQSIDIELVKNVKLDLKLKQSLQRIDEIVVSSITREEVTFKQRSSQRAILPTYVSEKPALFGEPDIIKVLEFQPGIVFQSEGSSFFHVRGGNFDQNLIILDEATIFNPSHMLGLFSPIIPDAIQSVDVYKSDYPVNMGGRLSSVIDIRTKDGNKNRFAASGNIGLISARATVEGPIKKESSSYFVSFRRSYFDAYIKPSQPNLDGLYFNDFTTKLNFKPSDNDRLYFTLYTGKDVFRVKQGVDDQNGLNWGNTSITARWNHNFGLKAFNNVTMCFSNYDYYLYSSTKQNIYWNSQIANLSLKDELAVYFSPTFTLKSGLKLSLYNFNPGNYYNPANSNHIQVSPVNSREWILYSGAEHKVLPFLMLNYGMRFTFWSNVGESFVVQYNENHEQTGIKNYKKDEEFYSHVGIEPRISASIKTGELSAIKASYSRNYQYLNLITNSVSPFSSLEVWLPAGPNIKPQFSDIADVGFVTEMAGISMRTDLYYKLLYNQIGYKYHASMLVNPQIEGELRQGRGYSYGVEFSLRKEKCRFTGGIEYSFSRAFLKIEDLNNNKVFPASFDRPHNAVFDINYHISQRWIVTANYHVMSGARISTPTSFFYYKGYQTPVYTSQNNDRLPTYKRLDISTCITLNKPARKFYHTLTIAVMNFLANKNPSFLYFNKMQKENGEFEVPSNKLINTQLEPSMRYIYGFVPSISYNFRF